MKKITSTSLLAISMLCIAGSNVWAQGGKPRERSQDRMQAKIVKPDAAQQNDRLQDRDRGSDKDFDRIRDRERDRDVDMQFEPDEDSVGGKIYAHQLMTMEERNAYRKSLREQSSDEQRKLLREKHRQEMLERAKNRKVKVAN